MTGDRCCIADRKTVATVTEIFSGAGREKAVFWGGFEHEHEWEGRSQGQAEPGGGFL